MTQPVLSAGLTGAVASGAMNAPGGMHASVLIGAFSGAAIFVLSSTEFSPLKMCVLFVVSIAAGIVAAPFAAQFISAITPASVTAREPVGALVSSAIAVRFLMAVSKNSGSLINIFRPKGNNDGTH